jgi:hypothetical protein
MTTETHSKANEIWLIFFFICFVIVLVGIGLLAVCTYNVNAPEGKPAAGEHGMLLPQQHAHPVFNA